MDLEAPLQVGRKPLSLFAIVSILGGILGFVLIAVLSVLYIVRISASPSGEQALGYSSGLYEALLTFQNVLGKYPPQGTSLLTPKLIDDIEASHTKIFEECKDSKDEHCIHFSSSTFASKIQPPFEGTIRKLLEDYQNNATERPQIKNYIEQLLLAAKTKLISSCFMNKTADILIEETSLPNKFTKLEDDLVKLETAKSQEISGQRLKLESIQKQLEEQQALANKISIEKKSIENEKNNILSELTRCEQALQSAQSTEAEKLVQAKKDFQIQNEAMKSSYQTEIIQLKHQVTTIENKRLSIFGELTRCKQDLQSALSSELGKIEQAKNEMENYENEKRVMEDRRKLLEQNLEPLNAEVVRLRVDLLKEKSQHEHEINALTVELKGSKAALEEIKKANASSEELNKLIEGYNRKQQVLDSEAHTLRHSQVLLKEREELMRQEFDKLEGERPRLEKTKSDLAEQQRTLQAYQENFEKEKAALLANNSDLTVKIDGLVPKISALEEEKRRNSAEYARVVQEFNILKAENLSLKNSLVIQHEELANTKLSLKNELVSKISALEEEKNRDSVEYAQAVQEFNRKLELLKGENLSLTKLLDIRRVELENTKLSLEKELALKSG